LIVSVRSGLSARSQRGILQLDQEFLAVVCVIRFDREPHALGLAVHLNTEEVRNWWTSRGSRQGYASQPFRLPECGVGRYSRRRSADIPGCGDRRTGQYSYCYLTIFWAELAVTIMAVLTFGAAFAMIVVPVLSRLVNATALGMTGKPPHRFASDTSIPS
jgi:hypothetical protein